MSLGVTVAAMAALVLGGEEGPGWKPEGVHQGVKVESRQRPGTQVMEVRAVGTLDAPPEAVWKVITEVDRYPATMPHVSFARLLKQEGPAVRHWYLVVNPPVVSNRDYAIRMETQVSSSRWRAQWTTSPLAPAPHEGNVRITQNEGFWELEPREGGKTQVTYYVWVDPAGRVPNFLANKANRDAIPDLFRAVERHAQGLGTAR
ncbi:MAG: SRPBCC family protein [Myxococcota bacterium]|nr:SRPBCC family protein [Myxococcota bacterium]